MIGETQQVSGARTIRTFVDVVDPDDLAKAHAAQDAIELARGGDGPFEAPDWNTESRRSK